MAYTRADIRTETRDYLAENAESTSGIWTDAQLSRFIRAEIRGFPRKGIYIQERDTTPAVIDQYDYSFPTGCYKVEKVERDWGTAGKSLWQEVKGWEQYGNAIWLPVRPTTAWTMRISFQKGFADLTDDILVSDVPDDKIDVVVVGSSLRGLKKLAAYLGNVANWDSISKPDGVSISSVANYVQLISKEYMGLVQQFRTLRKPGEIDLVG